MRARGVQPEHAGQAQDHQAGGLAVFLVKLAFQFVDGPEKESTLNDVDRDAGRQVRRRVAQQGGFGPQTEHARVRGLVDEEHQRKQHAHENGPLQVQDQGGGKGQQQHGAVDARGHQAEADGFTVYHLKGDQQQHAAQGGHGQPAHQRGQHKEHGQGQQTGIHGAHAGVAAGGDHQGAAGEGAAARYARGQARRDIAQALADEFLAAVEAVALDGGHLLADGQRFHRAQQGDGQGGHEQIAQSRDVESRGQGKGRDHVGDGPHQGYAVFLDLEDRAHGPHQGQGDQGGREASGNAAQGHDQDYGQHGQAQAPVVDLVQISKSHADLGEEPGGLGPGQAQHGFELPRGDEQGRARGKGHHDRVGDEVGQIAQTGQPHAHLDQPAEQGQAEDIGHARFFGQAGKQRAAYAHRRHGGKEHHGNGVGGSGGQIAGRAPERGHDHRQHTGVNAVLRVYPGNKGVGHGLGNSHGRHGQRGHEIRPEIACRVGLQGIQKGKESGGAHIHLGVGEGPEAVSWG